MPLVLGVVLLQTKLYILMKTTTITVLVAALLCTGCQLNRRSMRESNYQIWLNKADITYTEQLTGQAEQSRFLGIDFKRLFARKYDMGGIGNLPPDPTTGNSVSSINSSVLASSNGGVDSPVNIFNLNNIIGLNSGISRVEQFAINDLIKKNPGYDLIMFPQFEVQRKWYVFGSKTAVVVKARMAKMNPNAN